MATFKITASFERDGQIIDCTQAETMGEFYCQTFATREEAEDARETLQDEVGEYGLDPSTSYSVEEIPGEAE